MSGNWFTPQQWRFLFVVICLTGMVLGAILLSRLQNPRQKDISESFTDVVSRKKQKHKETSSSYYATQEYKPESFTFDPNEADSTQLLRLGLAPFQVRSIYRYRAKGGRYTCVDDFRRVYRLTNEQWQHLSPLIVIAEKYRPVKLVDTYDRREYVGGDSVRKAVDAERARRDSLRSTYPKKFTASETVDVNTADSALLCRIPGIGSYYASQIIRHRRRLGGLTSTSQLLEIQDFPADALAWMEVSSSPEIHKLDINHLSERRLMRHPYMGYYRASEIVSYRKVHGPLQSIEALKSLPHFSAEDILRLQPYLEFK